MQTFQQELAQKLLNDYSYDLSSLVVMFPSLRARTFFNDAVSNLVTKPMWQPKWTTIDELMEAGSGLVRGERIQLITELFKIYEKHHPGETIDKFYFWGEMLISDFDMIDKYLINASMLLRNIEDIKEIESDVSYITPEQEKIILRFWSSIYNGESLSKHKERFLKVWRSLPQIYQEYREALKKLGIGYPGLFYRETAERIKRGESIPIAPKRYVVAGFNALSKSEKVLFDYLAKSEHGAEFYWDYDSYYVDNKDHEAGMFLRDNLKRYPTDGISHNNFVDVKKRIGATACVSNILQVKHIGNILEAIPKNELNKQTAIVLTDENLLIPLLHALPERVKRVNVTMGYPIKGSITYSFVERLILLQAHSRIKSDGINFYHQDVTGLLSHPYIVDCCQQSAAKYNDEITTKRMIYISGNLFADDSILSSIFTPTSSWMELSKYLVDVLNIIMRHTPIDQHAQIEQLRVVAEEITKTANSVDKCDVEVPTEIFTSLLRRHLQTLTIPYEGEPLEGIQIMGILETRNIDFKNVIILSMTDANFPGSRTEQPSFVPYNLRIAYELPTPEQHEAMYAYYLYRLIQRAENVEMLYCSRADEKSTGERSRYIYQLDFESPYKVEKHSVGVDSSLDPQHNIVIPKGEYEMSMLNRYSDTKFKNSLSPTALFRYIECPLKFYFASIAHLKSRDELSDKIDALAFGNILHDSMELLYKKCVKGVKNPQQLISKLRDRATIEHAVDQTICALLGGDGSRAKQDFSGDTILVRDIIIKYIMNGIMRYDESRDGYTISHLEEDVECQYPLTSGITVRLSGRADRIDTLVDNTMQVIDYKSGNRPHLEFDGIESLFHGEAEQRISNIFQTLLYSMMLKKKFGVDSKPSLYYASKMLDSEYSPLINDKSTGKMIERYSSVADVFESELTTILDELFNPLVEFKQTEDVEACKYCDFNRICKR